MISISDATRNVIFKERNDFLIQKQIRGTLYKTLDGGAFIHDAGLQPGGLEISFKAFLPDTKTTILKSIQSDSEPIYISTKYGVYKGKIRSVKDIKGNIDVTIWTDGEG